MSIETYDLLNTMLNNTISPLRNNDGYIKLCEAHCVGLGKIQDTINYMSDCLNVDIASGVWLDNIGAFVGVNRSAFDISRYFCVNSPDINVEKEFYFPKSSQWTKGSLNDTLFRQRIRAKIGYNISRGTRENNLAIIKGLTNANKVVITHSKDEYNNIIPMTLDVHLFGENIIFSSINSLRSDIENIFGVTVGLDKLEIN